MSPRDLEQKSSAGADPRWTLLTCILASSLSFVDASVTNVALPAIRSGFAADPQEVQWVVNAYLLPLSALLLFGGALGDQFGRRRLLILGTSLFGCSSLGCACAPTLQILLLGRMFQGLGASLLLPNSLALLNAAYSGERRGRAVGIWAAAGAASAAIAPLIGGWLVGTAGWPAIFYINLPLAAGAIGLAVGFVREGKTQSVQTDFLGAFLATAALGALTYGLTIWSSHRQMEPAALIGLGSGIVVLGAFVLVEYRRKESAMVPIPLLSNRCFSGLNLLTFLLYGAFGAAMLLIPYVLITSGSYSPFQAGLALLPLPVLMTSASPMVGSLAVRIGPRVPLTVGPLIVAVALLCCWMIEPHQDYWNGPLVPIVLMALGMTIAVAPLTASVLGSVEEQHVAMASGFNSAVARTGGLIATALLGAVLAQTGLELFGGFHRAMTICALVCALASAVAFVMLKNAKMKSD